MYDALIVGGGPAGLNAALVLGRCGRNVLLCDANNPRNAVSWGVNGFLTRDGCKPADLRRIGRHELEAYPSVEVRDIEVTDVERTEQGFAITLADGRREEAHKLLLATGLVEDLPEIEGFAELWGHSVHHCPYCDGWENRGRPVAVYAKSRDGVGLALEMRVWSEDVTLCTDGYKLSPRDRARLKRHGVAVNEAPVERLERDDEGLRCIRFKTGETLPRHAVFFIHGRRKISELVLKLGCELDEKGTVRTRAYEKTNVPGLYVAGDASRRVQFGIVAAAEGAMAAFAMNTELIKERLR
ncbi:MAG TPA: NAD(P)/FAD-dependent oxidoreductase [Beijerinckiaceae bacterium]